MRGISCEYPMCIVYDLGSIVGKSYLNGFKNEKCVLILVLLESERGILWFLAVLHKESRNEGA